MSGLGAVLLLSSHNQPGRWCRKQGSYLHLDFCAGPLASRRMRATVLEATVWEAPWPTTTCRFVFDFSPLCLFKCVYNMQVCITKNINICHLTFLHCVFSNVFVLPRISMFATPFTGISLTGHPLHASSLLREDEEAEACDRSVPQHQKSGLLVGRQV